MGDAMEILRDNLARLMTARGWSQHVLAAKSGVSQSAIGYVLRYRDRGDKRPGIEKIEMLAKPFGLEAWQLLCPVGALPAPEALDIELLRMSISGAADAFRSRGMLVDDERLAGAAAFLYRRVRDGTSLRSATDVVKDELAKYGANLASESDGSSGGKDSREPVGKGAVRTSPARAGRHTGRKGPRPEKRS